jgi:hypothetical protein
MAPEHLVSDSDDLAGISALMLDSSNSRHRAWHHIGRVHRSADQHRPDRQQMPKW